MKMHELNTTNWNSFPFEVDGVKFVSKISPTSPFMAKIATLPEGAFIAMNRMAVLDLVGKGLSREQIATELYRINEGGSHAVLELGE
jgi:hypothetical protein